MLRIGSVIFAFLLFACFLSPVAAKMPPPPENGCGPGHECSKCHSLSVKEAGELLSFAGSGVKVTSVKPAPSHGLYEVLVDQSGKNGVVYIDFGKKHLLQGQIVNLQTKQLVVAHDKELSRPQEPQKLDPAAIPVQHSFVMGNPRGSKKLFVFDDPDCPYCRKLHLELKKLEKIAPDIAIHVMLMPLPMHPEAFDKSRAILETKKRDVFDRAFEGKSVPKPTKESSKAAVDAVIRFAGQNGINGTPTLVLPDGRVVVGARDAEELKRLVEGK